MEKQAKIPCLNLKDQHNQIKYEIFEAFEQVYENTAFSDGPFVEEFERSFATFCDAKYSAAVNSGTSALYLSL